MHNKRQQMQPPPIKKTALVYKAVKYHLSYNKLKHQKAARKKNKEKSNMDFLTPY